LDALTQRLDALAVDPNAPHRVARINRLTRQIDAAGLGDLTAWISSQLPEWPDEKRSELIGDTFDHAWFASVLDLVLASDDHLAAFDGAAHSNAVAEFAATDRAHLTATRHRVRRLVAERLTQVRTEHHDQDLFLDRELDKKRRLKTLRELMRQAPDVLLAAKPCWALSPLLVSQLLPPDQLFDVVIFDEASQVQPAEAMAAMARARTAVIAGDSKQLPPTAFFESALEADEPVDEDNAEGSEALTVDVESVLEAFNRALGASLAGEYYLGWHYRSQDARLIAPSNAYFYDNRMTTFPGTAIDPPVTFVEVTGAESAQGTSPAEVRRVVELVIEHARTRPEESLGVITMGLSHAEAIDRAMQLRLRDEPTLREWFTEGGHEPFFIKNLERVQGDERDAIVLSIGYGKAGGRMMHRFGPLNMAGGERRLNVAITRAKRRMTMVAGFSPDDLDPEKLRSEGSQRLADYLRYAARGARNATGAVRGTPVLNPFEIQVRNRLLAAGITVEPQWGEAGYYIDFVAKHPTEPDRMVLAIEADGGTYHSAQTTRARDRLRQEHLERLGWRFHRIWSTEWFRHPDREVARVKAAFDEAVAYADGKPVTAPEPAGDVDAGRTGDDAEIGEIVEALVDTPERGPRPEVPMGLAITEYPDEQLTSMVEWVLADGGLRTDDELAKETREALGLGRGSRIDARVAAAIADVRKRAADPSF
jgi:very-short-patch-repair endonuclease